MNYTEAIGLVRYLVSTGISLDDAVNNPAVSEDYKSRIKRTLKEEETIVLQPARILVNDENHIDWLKNEDRSKWCYWPALRQFLLTNKGWSNPSVQSLDTETDKILSRLASPNSKDAFDIRGLVLGFVQSGKTSNYTALIAKAADSGYRLIIVLAGIDNGLRLQTQQRLKRELVGTSGGNSVPLPEMGKRWHEFTQAELRGDFQPGSVNNAALQGSQPVLLVVKKNTHVLHRLLRWINEAPPDVMRDIPLLVIDDEADLASVDTRGTRQTEDDPLPEDYAEPSVINGLIRNLLSLFHHKAYVAYTATPFANILIPHDNYDPNVSDDLYPRNFMVDLPKPHAYFGAEELFGRMDDVSEEQADGMNVIRHISDEAVIALQESQIPPILEKAILSFVLAGAARTARESNDFPATMLIHISLRVIDQLQIRSEVEQKFSEIKDEWRYDRAKGILEKMRVLWEGDFRPVTQDLHNKLDIGFKELEPHIGHFLESIQVRTVNSVSGDVLDYAVEPTLKAIAIGGNKLSRGLTLEGLLVSVFVRRSVTYDSLMQMGRWFGFREGYDDLTRIYTTAELAQWFSDLAFVEHRLREDIRVYEEQQKTPLDVGMRIKQHPIMQITSRVKRRFSSETTISLSYSGQVEQTFMFPLNRLDDLSYQAEANLTAVKDLLSSLREPDIGTKGPIWSNVSTEHILDFLNKFKIDQCARNISLPLISSYIKHQGEKGELVRWTVAVRGKGAKEDKLDLGYVDWGLSSGKIKQMSRSRYIHTNSLGVITSPGDETIGFSQEQIKKVKEIAAENNEAENKAARRVRSPEEGLILFYPISRKSKPQTGKGTVRGPLFENLNDPRVRDLIGIAISFPFSDHSQPVETYLEGTKAWMPVEE